MSTNTLKLIDEIFFECRTYSELVSAPWIADEALKKYQYWKDRNYHFRWNVIFLGRNILLITLIVSPLGGEISSVLSFIMKYFPILQVFVLLGLHRQCFTVYTCHEYFIHKLYVSCNVSHLLDSQFVVCFHSSNIFELYQ